MDLSTLKPVDQNTFVPKHPVTGESIGDMQFVVSSKDSAEYEKAKNAIIKRRKDSGKLELTIEEYQEEEVNLLAELIQSWSGVEWEGAKLNCTHGNKVKILREIKWLRDQIDIFSGKRANFFPGLLSGSQKQ
jgi:hypothetical protein